MFLKHAAIPTAPAAHLKSLLGTLKTREAQLIQTLYPDTPTETLQERLKEGLATFPQEAKEIDTSPQNPHAKLHSILAQQGQIETQRAKDGIGYKGGFKTYAKDAGAIWFYYVANTVITHEETVVLCSLYDSCEMSESDILAPKRVLVNCNFKDDSDPDVGEREREPYEEFSRRAHRVPLSPFRAEIKKFLINGQVVHALQTAQNATRFLEKGPNDHWKLKEMPIERVFGDPQDSEKFMARLPQKTQHLYRQAGTVQNLYSPQFWRTQNREDIAQSLENLGLTDSLDYAKLLTLSFEHDDGKFLTPVDGLPQRVVVGDSRPTELPNKRQAMDVPLMNEKLVQHPSAPATPGAGLSSLTMTGFHDHYKSLSYQRNEGRMDMPKGLHYLVKFHSCYMQHHHLALAEFANETDWLMLPLLRLFQSCDLYSKEKPTADDISGLFKFSEHIETGYKQLLKLKESDDVLSVKIGFPVINRLPA